MNFFSLKSNPAYLGKDIINKPVIILRYKIIVFLFLVIATYIIDFSQCAHFGLYEDDYWSIAAGYSMHFHELFNRFVSIFSHWPTGRPLNHFLPLLLGYIAGSIHSITVLYYFGAFCLAFNCYFVFLIAYELLDFRSAIIASVAYLIFPADSTRQLLIHISHVQSSMTFALLACYLWLHTERYRFWSYPIAALCLMSYETAFLIFISLPLFTVIYNRKDTFLRLFAHGIYCMIVLILFYIVRKFIGDARVTDYLSSPGETIIKSISSTYIGPITIFKSIYYSVVLGVRYIGVQSFIVALVSLVGIILLCRLYRSNEIILRSKASYIYLLVAAFIALGSAYLLTLVNYPPVQLYGRLTSTHVAAAFPFAMLVGIISAVVGQSKGILKTAYYIILAFGLISTISNARLVQDGYVATWQTEKGFWQQILNMAPDLDKNSTVIVYGTPAPTQTLPVVMANSWADYFACRALYNFALPYDSDEGVKFGHLGVIPELWNFKIKGTTIIAWTPRYWSLEAKNVIHGQLPFSQVVSNNLVLFNSNNGKLERVNSIKLRINTNAGAPADIYFVSTKHTPQPVIAKPQSELFQELWTK